MAGYKQTLEGMEPQSLYGFDGETLIEDTRKLRSLVIHDQMGIRDGNLEIEQDHDTFPCYWMSGPISTIDSYEQRSIRFCPNGIQPEGPVNGISYFPKAFIYAHHHSDWNYSKKEFTYIVSGKRDYSYIGWQGRRSDGQAYDFTSYIDPILHHEGLITVYEELNRYTSDHLCIWFPAYNDLIRLDSNIRPFAQRESDLGDMLTIRFKENKLSIWKNLDILFEKTYNKDITTLNFDTVEHNLSIGGVGTNTRVNGRVLAELTQDRCHIPTTLDNLAIFNHFVPDLEIMRLYQKLFNFHDMVLKEKPTFYFDYQDPQYTNNGALRNYGTGSASSMTIMGDRHSVLYREQGPFKLTHSMKFVNAAPVWQWTNYNRDHLININDDFTYFQHFKIENGERGCIFEQTNETPLWFGMSIWANSKGGSHAPGCVELRIDAGNGSYLLTDELDIDAWHEYIIIKKGNFLTVIFDSKVVLDNKLITPRTLQHASTNISTGRLLIGEGQLVPTVAHLANTIVFDRALSRRMVDAMIDFEHVYYVKGIITLDSGNPMRAKIRAYYHHNGEFINEVWSDPQTGAYVIHLRDNWPVDIVAIDDTDIRSRLRAYGPLIPYCRPYDTAYLSY